MSLWKLLNSPFPYNRSWVEIGVKMIEISVKQYLARWRASSLPEAITFDPTIGFSKYYVFRKLYIHTFPLAQDQLN